MIEHFKTAVCHKYADFRTRSTRIEYWFFILAYILLSFILIIPFMGSMGSLLSADPETLQDTGIGILPKITMGIWILMALALVIPSLAISVRRLHDSGKSGWWYLIAFIPYIGSLILIVFMCLDSQPGRNKWGTNPHELASGDEISGHLIEEDIV